MPSLLHLRVFNQEFYLEDTPAMEAEAIDLFEQAKKKLQRSSPEHLRTRELTLKRVSSEFRPVVLRSMEDSYSVTHNSAPQSNWERICGLSPRPRCVWWWNDNPSKWFVTHYCCP